jgi:hypothetical protein
VDVEVDWIESIWKGRWALWFRWGQGLLPIGHWDSLVGTRCEERSPATDGECLEELAPAF